MRRLPLFDPEVDKAEARRKSEPNYGDPNRPVDRCHLCFGCRNEYKVLIDAEKITDFPPLCNLSTDIQVEEIADRAGLNDEEKEMLRAGLDPAEWARHELGFEPRWYQEDILRCSSRYTINRWGRRSGKSTTLVIKLLHRIATRENYKVLVIAPFQEQVNLIFNDREMGIEKRLEDSKTLKAMVKSYVKSPSRRMEFSNGSVISGMTAGIKTGSGASKIRGQGASLLWVDEADLLGEGELTSILAILATNSEVELWMTGTPTGKREHFYKHCVEKSRGFKEWHFPSSVSPAWNPHLENMLRNSYTESGYLAEFEAGFPVLKQGVFPAYLVDDAIKDYEPLTLTLRDSWLYGLGVDWNETDTGVYMILLGYNPQDQKFWVVRKWIVSREEFTQLRSVEMITQINSTWNPSFIYVDRGAGSTQVEMLHEFGKKNQSSGLLTKVKAIDFGGKVEIHDPLLGLQKKEVKPLIVGLALRRLEQKQVILPKIEYKGEGTEGLVNQIMNYRIARYTAEGRPIYVDENDHALTAWMLALYGFWMEHTDLANPRPVSHIGIVQPGGDDERLAKRVAEQLPFSTITFVVDKADKEKEKQDKRKSLSIVGRGFDMPYTTRNTGDIVRVQKDRPKRKNIAPSFSSGKKFKRKSF